MSETTQTWSAPMPTSARGCASLPPRATRPATPPLWLTAGGQTALITGDAIHHPLQCAEPQLGFVSDADAEQCRATRRHLLAEAVDTGALMLGSHFPALPGGLVIPAGDAWRFTPAPVEHQGPAG